MSYMLPGGLWMDGRLIREAELKPITGNIERLLTEHSVSASSWPRFVTSVLTSMVANIGEQQCTSEIIDRLAVGDRQYLLLRVVASLHGDTLWVSVPCVACGEWFNLGIQRSKLPVKLAGSDYPFTVLEHEGKQLRLCVPTGADQHLILGLDENDAVNVLLQCCLLAVDGNPPSPDYVATLNGEVISLIEDALDEIAPDVGTRLQTHCPECDAEQLVEIDPYGDVQWLSMYLNEEIHTIASHYHWNEADILALPRNQRRIYLRLIEKSQGLYQ